MNDTELATFIRAIARQEAQKVLKEWIALKADQAKEHELLMEKNHQKAMLDVLGYHGQG
jgi:hypothetical protein